MSLRFVITVLVSSAGCSQLFGLDAPVRATNDTDDGGTDSAGPDDAGSDSSTDGAVDGGVTPFVRLIDIDNAKVTGGPHADYPLVVVASETWLRSRSNGGDVARTDGFDIYFSADQAGATRLAHEVESYDASSGALVAWIKIPSLTATSTLYLHYGDTSITTSQQNRPAVWTGSYELVLHLGNTTDATGKNAISGSNTTSTAGRFGSAISFNGTNSAINCGSDAAIDNVFAGGGTLEAWIRPTSYGENSVARILDKGRGSGWAWFVDNANQPNAKAFLHGYQAQGQWGAPTNVIALNAWQHVAVVYDKGSSSNNPQMYINGAAVNVTEAQTPTGAAADDGAFDLFVGNTVDGDRTFEGTIDEVRLIATSRTAAWFVTQYANHSAPQTFYSISAPL